MIHAVQQALETAMEKDVRIRAGLPINFRSYLGTGKESPYLIQLVVGLSKKCLKDFLGLSLQTPLTHLSI